MRVLQVALGDVRHAGPQPVPIIGQDDAPLRIEPVAVAQPPYMAGQPFDLLGHVQVVPRPRRPKVVGEEQVGPVALRGQQPVQRQHRPRVAHSHHVLAEREVERFVAPVGFVHDGVARVQQVAAAPDLRWPQNPHRGEPAQDPILPVPQHDDVVLPAQVLIKAVSLGPVVVPLEEAPQLRLIRRGEGGHLHDGGPKFRADRHRPFLPRPPDEDQQQQDLEGQQTHVEEVV